MDGVGIPPLHTFQKQTSKFYGGHVFKGLQRCVLIFTLRNTEEHFHTFSKTLGFLDFARMGVDMNPPMGDYGFVVNEQVDACKSDGMKCRSDSPSNPR